MAFFNSLLKDFFLYNSDLLFRVPPFVLFMFPVANSSQDKLTFLRMFLCSLLYANLHYIYLSDYSQKSINYNAAD